MTSLGEGLAVGFGAMGAQAAGGAQGFTQFLKMYADRKAQEKGQNFQREMTDRDEQFKREMVALQLGGEREMEAERQKGRIELERIRQGALGEEYAANQALLTADLNRDPDLNTRYRNLVVSAGGKLNANSSPDDTAKMGMAIFGGTTGAGAMQALGRVGAGAHEDRAYLAAFGGKSTILARTGDDRAVTAEAQANRKLLGAVEGGLGKQATILGGALTQLTSGNVLPEAQLNDISLKIEAAASAVDGWRTQHGDFLDSAAEAGHRSARDALIAAEKLVGQLRGATDGARELSAKEEASHETEVGDVIGTYATAVGGTKATHDKVSRAVLEWATKGRPDTEAAFGTIQQYSGKDFEPYTNRHGDELYMVDPQLQVLQSVLESRPSLTLAELAKLVVTEATTTAATPLAPKPLAAALNYLRAGSKAIESQKRAYDLEVQRDTTHTAIAHAIDKLQAVMGQQQFDKVGLLASVEDLMKSQVNKDTGAPDPAAIAEKLGPIITAQYFDKLKGGVAITEPEKIAQTINSLSQTLPEEGKEQGSAFGLIARDIYNKLTQRYRDAGQRNNWRGIDYRNTYEEVSAASTAARTGDRTIYRSKMVARGDIDINGFAALLSDVSGGGRDHIANIFGTDKYGLIGDFLATLDSKARPGLRGLNYHGRVVAHMQSMSHEAGLGLYRKPDYLTFDEVERHLITREGKPVSWKQLGRPPNEAVTGYGSVHHLRDASVASPFEAYTRLRGRVLEYNEIRKAFIELWEDQSNREAYFDVALSHLPDGSPERKQTIDYLNRLFDGVTAADNKAQLIRGGSGHPSTYFFKSGDPEVSVDLEPGAAIATAPEHEDLAALVSNRRQPRAMLLERRKRVSELRDAAQGELLTAQTPGEKNRMAAELRRQEKEVHDIDVEEWLSEPTVVKAMDELWFKPFRDTLFSVVTKSEVAAGASVLAPLSSAEEGKPPHMLDLSPKALAEKFSVWFDNYAGAPNKLAMDAKQPPRKTQFVGDIEKATSTAEAIRAFARGIRDTISSKVDMAKWLQLNVQDPTNIYGPDFVVQQANYMGEFNDYLDFRFKQSKAAVIEGDSRLAEGHGRLAPEMQAHLSPELWHTLRAKPQLRSLLTLLLADKLVSAKK